MFKVQFQHIDEKDIIFIVYHLGMHMDLDIVK